MRILVTGATGTVGTALLRQCRQAGIFVHYLTTSEAKITRNDHQHGFYWEPSNGAIDLDSLDGVSVIIHLAGAPVAKRWSAAYKKEIRDSRVQGAKLLLMALKKRKNTVSHFVTAGGVDRYPSSFEQSYEEDSQAVGNGFLSRVVIAWEEAADAFQEHGLAVTKLRTGMVLSRDGDALPQLAKVIRLRMGSVMGNGRQKVSWIHLEDLARMYLFVIQHKLKGVFNAAAPQVVTHEELMQALARQLNRRLWLPKTPAWVLKLALGEMANLLLESRNVRTQKIIDNGFHFQYPRLEDALRDLLG